MTFDPKHFAALRRAILRWYEKNKRDLPWRGATDLYEVWVSEVMLQQTTTKTVVGYYRRFLNHFPDVTSLATAKLDEVNRLWEGLGYYRRARQLHQAAQTVVEKYGGIIPTDVEAFHNLPGVGRYTAGAVLSIALDKRLPILEANTIRLHCRLLGITTDPSSGETNKNLWQFAEDILPRRQPGKFNQAIMDLGSIICRPKNPDCETCPVHFCCRAFQGGLQNNIPQPGKEKNIEHRIEAALVVRKAKKFLMVRYPASARWGGLWDFPRVEATHSRHTEEYNPLSDSSLPQKFLSLTGQTVQLTNVVSSVRHTVTRFRIKLFFCEGTLMRTAKSRDAATSEKIETDWVSLANLGALPLNSTARNFCSKYLLR